MRFAFLCLCVVLSGCDVQYTTTKVDGVLLPPGADGQKRIVPVVIKSTSTPFSAPKTTVEVLDSPTYTENQ